MSSCRTYTNLLGIEGRTENAMCAKIRAMIRCSFQASGSWCLSPVDGFAPFQKGQRKDMQRVNLARSSVAEHVSIVGIRAAKPLQPILEHELPTRFVVSLAHEAFRSSAHGLKQHRSAWGYRAALPLLGCSPPECPRRFYIACLDCPDLGAHPEKKRLQLSNAQFLR